MRLQPSLLGPAGGARALELGPNPEQRHLDRAIEQGKMANLMPNAPPGTFLPFGAAPPQSAQVQVQTRRDIPSRLLHLTTQPSGYVSPLASLSSEGRALINDPYQAAIEIVDKAAAGPFSWADKLTLETLQQGGLSSHFKPASALNLPFMEKKTDFHQFRNITSLDDLVTASLKGYVHHLHASKDLNELFQKATVIAAGSYAPGTKGQYKRAWDRFAKFCR